MEIMYFCIKKDRCIIGLGQLTAFFQLICLVCKEINIREHICVYVCVVFTNMVISLNLSKSLQEGI